MWSLLKYPAAYGLLVGRDLNFKDIACREVRDVLQWFDLCTTTCRTSWLPLEE
jgi:hypothetical protein